MKRKFSRKYLKVSALALVTMCASLGQANANMTGKLSLLQEFDFQASSGQPSFPSFAKFADVSYNLKLTHQARFSGNVGPFDSKSLIPHNPQAILVLKKVESPQDYVTALAFLLFPSPGSDRIIATQNPSDPIANLTIDQIGRLIQGITQGNMKDAATIYDVISSGSATPDQALAHEFYGYDVRRKLMGMYIHRIRSQIHMFDPDLNPDLQQGGDSTNIHHPVTDEIMTTDQCRDFVREFASNAIPVVQSVIRKFGVSVPDSEAKSYNGGIARFEKKRKELMQWRFSEVLALAFTEESMGERAQLSLIPRMLLTFGLFKSRTADDVRTLYKSAFGVTLSDDFETKILTQDAYRALRKSSLDLSQLTPDILRMLSYGYEVFDAEAPVELPYAVAQYTPKFEHESPDMEPLAYFFPDCVETSILNAFNFLHFKFSGNKTFDIPSLRNTLIGQFYQEYPTIDAQSSKDARNAWASLVSRVPGVTYCKSTKKGRAPTYELKSGIKNSLKIFKFLLGDQSHFFSAESDLTKAWTDLLKTFYQNQDESIEVQAFSSPVLDSDLGDILFSIKKGTALMFTFSSYV